MFPGVQSGLNFAMDLIKYVLVIALPDDDTFGYLILVSYCSYILGAVSYGSFAFRPSRVRAAAAAAKGEDQEEASNGRDNPAFEGGAEEKAAPSS